MSHDPNAHSENENGILYDGCAECEERAAAGLEGLLRLDSTNIDLLWNRMLNTEYYGKGKPEAGVYISYCERQLGHELYLMAVLLERTGEDVWNPARFSS